jgi:hypothetical protein
MMQATSVRRFTEASERAGIEITVADQSGRADVDLPSEDLEVLGVVGQQGNPVHTRGVSETTLIAASSSGPSSDSSTRVRALNHATVAAIERLHGMLLSSGR